MANHEQLRTSAQCALENLDQFVESDSDDNDYVYRARDELRAALG